MVKMSGAVDVYKLDLVVLDKLPQEGNAGGDVLEPLAAGCGFR